MESVNLGEVVLTLTATDADGANTDNSKITFGFEVACTQDWFDLDANSGNLNLIKREGEREKERGREQRTLKQYKMRIFFS